MKVNFNTLMLSYRGEPMKDEKNEAVYAKTVICDVLSAINQAPVDEKMEMAKLVAAIWQSVGEIEVSPKQVELIRKYCKGLPVNLFAQIYKLLEQ